MKCGEAQKRERQQFLEMWGEKGVGKPMEKEIEWKEKEGANRRSQRDLP